MLGHWLREKGDKGERPTRVGGGQAAPAGRPQERSDMVDSYSRGDGRFGERREQLAVRARILEFIEVAWQRLPGSLHELPRDGTDWLVLFPHAPSDSPQECGAEE